MRRSARGNHLGGQLTRGGCTYPSGSLEAARSSVRYGDHPAPTYVLTLTIKRSDLEMVMMGAKTLEAQIADGTAQRNPYEAEPGNPIAE